MMLVHDTSCSACFCKDCCKDLGQQAKRIMLGKAPYRSECQMLGWQVQEASQAGVLATSWRAKAAEATKKVHMLPH